MALVLAAPPSSAGPAQPQMSIAGVAASDQSGDVHLHLPDGSIVTAPKLRDQRSLSDPALAEDGHTVGWLGNYDTCCQSYPVPQQLVIWRSGRVIRRIDASAMIWRWRFYKDGKEVGFADGPTHGSHVPYSYKLYDVATGRLIREIPGNSKLDQQWAILLLPPPAVQGQKE